MAAVAGGTILTVMPVVGAMTRDAGARTLDLVVRFDAMAGSAFETFMCAGERKVRLQIMIERPIGPVRRIVALLTSLAERSHVRVVLSVAGDAVDRRGLKFLR